MSKKLKFSYHEDIFDDRKYFNINISIYNSENKLVEKINDVPALIVASIEDKDRYKNIIDFLYNFNELINNISIYKVRNPSEFKVFKQVYEKNYEEIKESIIEIIREEAKIKIRELKSSLSEYESFLDNNQFYDIKPTISSYFINSWNSTIDKQIDVEEKFLDDFVVDSQSYLKQKKKIESLINKKI